MDFNQILELIKTVSASELTAFQYEEGNQKILMHTGNVVWNGMSVDMGSVANGTVNTGAVNPGATGSVVNASASVNTAEMNSSVSAAVSSVSAASVVETRTAQTGNMVTAPLVGRFYVAPSEDAAPFVKVGDSVKKGQTLAIVEAMKLMNEIECEYDGVVAEVLVTDGEAVEYGQSLFRIV